MDITVKQYILTEEQISYIINIESVKNARQQLTDSITSIVKFTVNLPSNIRQSIEDGVGISLKSDIPFRWIKGDTPPHIDKGEDAFLKTILIYLTDSPGSLIINGENYEIKKGNSYIFNEGLSHETVNTENSVRLMIGPMSETGFPVGTFLIYYSSLSDAQTNTNPQYQPISLPTNQVANNSELDVPFPSFTGSWTVYSESPSGSFPPGTIVYPGYNLTDVTAYLFYITPPPCFLEGTKILCNINEKDLWIPIELINPGTLVKTIQDGYKKVDMIGHTKLYNSGSPIRTKHALYICPQKNYPELTEDLCITGCHSILVDSITDEQRIQTIGHIGRIYITGRKYRLMACVDTRTHPLESEGLFTIWHLALENNDYYSNYGIYANGLLVETTSKRYLKEMSGMILKKI